LKLNLLRQLYSLTVGAMYTLCNKYTMANQRKQRYLSGTKQI